MDQEHVCPLCFFKLILCIKCMFILNMCLLFEDVIDVLEVIVLRASNVFLATKEVLCIIVHGN